MTQLKKVLRVFLVIGVAYVISYTFLWAQVQSDAIQRRPQLPSDTIARLKIFDIYLASRTTSSQRRLQEIQSQQQRLAEELHSLNAVLAASPTLLGHEGAAFLSIQELLLSASGLLERAEQFIDQVDTHLMHVNESLITGTPRDGIIAELSNLPELERDRQELQDTLDIALSRIEVGLRVDRSSLTQYAYLKWEQLSVYYVRQRQLSQDQKDSGKEISDAAVRFREIADRLPVFYYTGGIFAL